MKTAPLPVFDGHNDILLRMQMAPKKRGAIWLTGEGRGHLDLPRMQAGGFAAGIFAIYIPSPAAPGAPDYDAMMDNPPYEIELPAMIPLGVAQPIALSMAGHFLWMERASQGRFKIVRSVADIRANIHTIEYAIGLVGAGIGCALLPAFESHRNRTEMQIRPLQLPLAERELVLAFSKESQHQSAVKTLCEVAKKQA